MRTYGGLSWPLAFAVALALVAYLALFIGAFALMTGHIIDRLGHRAILVSAAVWVTAELGRGYLFTGFPWVLLGYSQARVLPVAQLASVTGVFGVSALVALVNAAFAQALLARRAASRIAVPASILGLVVVVVWWGQARLADGALTREGTSIRVGLVQGNVPQDEKWDRTRAAAIFERYLKMSREAARDGARLIIWPESSTPFYLEEDPFGRAAVRDLAVETGVPILIGSDQVERGPQFRYYNAAFLIGKDGATAAVYRKMHLVPFGEYVPLRRLLFFAAPLVEAVSDFSAGEQIVLWPVGRHLASTSICFEVVYPNLVRQFVLAGAELLTTITNDAWYGRSSAPYQHFEQATMRAIEAGRYLARSANTGVSGIIDPYGRIVAESELFEPAILVGEVRFLTRRTTYAMIGDLVGYLSVLLTIVAMASAWWAGRSGRTSGRARGGAGRGGDGARMPGPPSGTPWCADSGTIVTGSLRRRHLRWRM
jgi:apolipoprotein N-acyltransferase